MSSTLRNRLIALGCILAAGGVLAFVVLGGFVEKNLVYYWTPSELLSHGDQAYGPTIRLGGVVQAGSIDWKPDKTDLSFRVADTHKAGAASVLVNAHQIPPQMFRENIGVVVEGTYERSGVFKTQRLMVNHSNEYKAPHDVDDAGMPVNWQSSLASEEAKQ